jgi:hypothetical protein
MLVDVVRLRCRGVKRPREEVLSATPVRGELIMSNARPGTQYWRDRERPVLAGLLRPGSAQWLLPPLDYARVTRRNAQAMVIFGFEEVGVHRRRMEVFPQAWWARIVTAESSAEAPRARPDRDRTPPWREDG